MKLSKLQKNRTKFYGLYIRTRRDKNVRFETWLFTLFLMQQ